MIQMNAPGMDTNKQEIDLIELAKRLWGERKFLFKCWSRDRCRFGGCL